MPIPPQGSPYGFVKTASFVIDKIGTTIRAWNGTDGTLYTSGTDASTVINSALGALTSGRTWFETVCLKGNFTIPADSSILLPNYVDLDLYQAYLLKGPNGTTPIIQNADQVNGNKCIRIQGGYLDANRLGYSPTEGCKGIYINNNNIPQDVGGPVVFLEDVNIGNVYGNAFDVQLSASDQMILKNCRQIALQGTGCTRRGFDLKGGDSFVIGGRSGSYRENMALAGGRFFVSDFYFAGTAEGSTTNSCVYINANSRSMFYNCQIDYCNYHAFRVISADDVTFEAVHLIPKNVLTNNTYSAFRFENCLDYHVVDCKIIQYPGTTSLYKYGVEEIGTTDYGIIADCNFRKVGTAGIVTLGANTKVSDCWNGTTWAH